MGTDLALDLEHRVGITAVDLATEKILLRPADLPQGPIRRHAEQRNLYHVDGVGRIPLPGSPLWTLEAIEFISP